MARQLFFIPALLTASALLAGCDGDSSSSTSTTTTTGTTTGTGATGGTGGAGGGGTGGETGGGGQGGTGGAAAVCGDGLLADGEACDDGNTDASDGCDESCAVETGYTCVGEPSDCLTMCGDGILAGAETCDDGNVDASDGCDESCAVEAGYACDGAPSVCATTCGDGVIAGAETCDDGDGDPLDGCDAACLVEDGFTCAGEPSDCATTCGDGDIGGAETCDDGNTDPTDGCSAACLAEKGYACDGEPSACATICGDGVIAGDEVCDDLGAQGGDGCSADCAIEDGFICILEPSVCAPVCGDGIVAGAEACDDGDGVGGDGCSTLCTVDDGYTCAGEPSMCATVCGDGKIVALETCDDGDAAGGDGCSAMCQVEDGFTCAGLPSACLTTCGDGITAGAEACDDANAANNDGCSTTCTIDNGYYCSGTPSACVTQCGDGILAGTEQCDDGNPISGDGCSAQCTPNTGETCADPLLTLQAAQMGATYTWTVPAGGVLVADGDWGCDPNGVGPDVIAKLTKTSETLANGGQLLHVKADTPLATTTSYYLNLEIKGGSCAAGTGTSLKCNWYKDNWDAYLDVPPGDYWIFVAKNSAATAAVPFPQVTIVAEEVTPPAVGEGEGCFAPYTTASASYTPPGGAGMPHTWTIADGAVNSFDMSATWGEPGSISCDNTTSYGDIHGVDSVIEYTKQSPTSVLKIDVQNLDPVLTQSSLDLEVLSVCDSNNPAKVSRHCRAKLDTISITAPSPAGPVYLWVATEATGEEFNGASVQVTEIFPGVGESWPTAQPLAGSGPITPTSAQRLDAPTCFPAAGNIHWYSYTLTNDLFVLTPNAAGYVAFYDGAGQQVRCPAAASATPITWLGAPGETIYIAVQSPSPITAFTLDDVAYGGIQGEPTDMAITFPTSPSGEYGMAVDANQVVLADTVKVWSFPKTIGATATEYGTANGITSTHMGYDITFAGASLFSVDSTATTNVNRLFRLFDGTTWGPATGWDLTPTYPATSPSHAITSDGAGLFMVTRRTTTDASFYSFSPAGAGVPTLLGVSTSVWYVVGLAADATYFYVASNGVSGEGVYRILRSNVAAPAVKIATIDTGLTHNNIEVDSFVSAQTLYVRDAPGDIQAVINPAGASPGPTFVISTLGTVSDFAMVYDQTAAALYFWETETVATGRLLRLQ